MNESIAIYKRYLMLPILFILSCSSSDRIVETPKEFIGNWRSSNIKITVRKHDEAGYHFYSGKGEIMLQFNSDSSISGSIGQHSFSNGRLMKGSIYKVVCDSAGALFEDDPVGLKEISLWFHKIKPDSIQGNIRLTEDDGKFPMASFILIKE